MANIHFYYTIFDLAPGSEIVNNKKLSVLFENPTKRRQECLEILEETNLNANSFHSFFNKLHFYGSITEGFIIMCL